MTNEDCKCASKTDMRLVLMIIGMVILVSILGLTGCTLSFQNVMTSGTASDVVDSDPHTDTTANPNLTITAGL